MHAWTIDNWEDWKDFCLFMLVNGLLAADSIDLMEHAEVTPRGKQIAGAIVAMELKRQDFSLAESRAIAECVCGVSGVPLSVHFKKPPPA